MRRMRFQIAFLILFAVLRMTPPALAAEPAAAAVSLNTQELVFGNGSSGPFSLSWTAVRFGSERLSVNSTPLHFGLDYLIDYAAGTVTFSQPLQPKQIAQVEYAYDPG